MEFFRDMRRRGAGWRGRSGMFPELREQRRMISVGQRRCRTGRREAIFREVAAAQGAISGSADRSNGNVAQKKALSSPFRTCQEQISQFDKTNPIWMGRLSPVGAAIVRSRGWRPVASRWAFTGCFIFLAVRLRPGEAAPSITRSLPWPSLLGPPLRRVASLPGGARRIFRASGRRACSHPFPRCRPRAKGVPQPCVTVNSALFEVPRTLAQTLCACRTVGRMLPQLSRC
jgi:hypothetical protein